MIDTNLVFKSHVNGERFIFDKEGIFDCKSVFVIYLITCNDCGIQYVGLTTQHMHIRLNGHRSSVKNNMNTFLYKHFNTSNGHDFSKATIQIIDILDPAKHTSFELEQLENYWINTLDTVYPLGLNDKCKGVGNISKYKINNNNSNLVCYFNSNTKRYVRGHGLKKKYKSHINNDHEEMKDLINNLNLLFKNNIHEFYLKLKSLSKKKLLVLKIELIKADNPITNVINSYYINKFTTQREITRVMQRETIILPFNCKFIDRLSLNSILRDKSIEILLPQPIAEKLPLMIYYKYNTPIGRKLLNYN